MQFDQHEVKLRPVYRRPKRAATTPMTPAAAVGTYMALAAPVEVDLLELPEPVVEGLEPTPEGLATVPLQ